MIRTIKGLDLSKVEAQKQEQRLSRAGRILIVDGDGPAYRAAATVKRLDTAVRHFQSAILTEMAMAGCGSATVHLTHRKSHKNGRGFVLAAQPYQGNRKGKDKPPLLEPLREAMMDRSNWLPEFEVRMHFDVEADDAMIMQAHQLKDMGVIWSDDKDLRCTPYYYYDQATGVVQGFEPTGYIEQAFTPAGKLKIVGRGPMFFWCQMLMGDKADNVKGVKTLGGKLCGEVGAYQALHKARCVHEAANIVIDAYRAIDQNVVAEGFLLHLLQAPDDHVYDYMLSHKLSPENAEFVQECNNRPWMEKQEEEVDVPW